jgi:hypothetical protein
MKSELVGVTPESSMKDGEMKAKHRKAEYKRSIKEIRVAGMGL